MSVLAREFFLHLINNLVRLSLGMGYDMICVRNEKRTFRAPQVSTATIAKTKNPVIDKNDCLQIHLTNGIERMIHISFIDVPD